MAILENNNCYIPIGKSESEMTDEEKKQMENFLMMQKINRMSDRLHWHTELVKMQIRVYGDILNNS